MTYQLVGAACFGAVVGWYVYYINRYRTSDVQLSDLVTIIGVIGGSAVTALFDTGSDLFGAYGLGLCIGFFSYLIVLIIMVTASKNFDVDWFLDGRRKEPEKPFYIPDSVRETVTAMGDDKKGGGSSIN